MEIEHLLDGKIINVAFQSSFQRPHFPKLASGPGNIRTGIAGAGIQQP